VEAPDLELIYVGDPMCSWCWGFAPVLEHLDARFDMDLSVIAGGLRPGDASQEMDDSLKAYLDREWQKIEEQTGQRFDRTTLDREGWVYDTMTADTAIVTMRTHNSPETLRFFNRVQQAFYAEAVDVTETDSYPSLLEGFGVNTDAFVADLTSEEMKKTTWQDFVAAHRMGITGFPTLLLREGNAGHVLTRGYAPYEPIEAVIRGFVESEYPDAVSGLVCELDGEPC